MPPRFVARQLARPTGIFGRLMGKLMNRHNARLNAFAVQQLELRPSDRVLEIGFGGGVTLRQLVKDAAFVGGIDRSGDAVRWAKAAFSAPATARRVDFREGSVEAIPFEAASFDKVCTVNSVYFWPSLDAGFTEIRRVLSPSGRVAVGFLPKVWMDQMGFPVDIFTTRSPEEVLAALANTGFREARITRPEPTTRWNVIVATR
ncbi:MAG TPA: class I SAM-dependent methyltransferase [Gemmatimonadaceae bacterium]|nr:class I SAM-dependent methyltransferase [Gemmatimonadaceae bacterium]